MNALCKGKFTGSIKYYLNVLYKVNIIPSITFNNILSLLITLTYMLKKYKIDRQWLYCELFWHK